MAKVLFVIPHQDDETLAMGAAIRLHIEAGHNVYLLLLTDGINSAARGPTGLSRPTFSAYRDDEFIRASRQLGVRYDNIIFARNSVEDGLLTAQRARDSVLRFLEEHPGSWVKAYSYLSAPGRHSDHINSGQACRDLVNTGYITNMRYYVEQWNPIYSSFVSANPGVTLSQEHCSNISIVHKALDEYAVYDAYGGKLSIGYNSVGPAFDHVRQNTYSIKHS